MNDRTVHARSVVGQIVRYDRAGKWRIEYHGGGVHDETQRTVTLMEAVMAAVRWHHYYGGTIRWGLPGGSRFDREVGLLLPDETEDDDRA